MEEIKYQLLEMQEEILRQLEIDLNNSRIGMGDDEGDEIDEAAEGTYREFFSLLSQRDQQKLEQIRQALVAIEKNTYGICMNCDKKIPKKRLRVLPFAGYCVKCKDEMERTHIMAKPFQTDRSHIISDPDN